MALTKYSIPAGNRCSVPSGFKLQIGVLWTPEQISTLGWWDAADSSTITVATGVSQWDDKSGNAKHATQGTASMQPATGVATINGLNALSFDGDNDYLTIGSLTATTGVTLFSAVKVPTIATGRNGGIMFAADHNTNSNHFGGERTTSFQDWYISFFNTARVQLISDDASFVDNTNYLVYSRSETSTMYGRVFGVTSEVSTSSTFDGTVSTWLGNNPNIGGAAYVPTETVYGEMVLVQSPSTDTKERTEGYLAWKWGLVSSLPTDHPYKYNPPYA